MSTLVCFRESCLAENQHLLARLEDTNAMLQAVLWTGYDFPDPDPAL
jgi:hypothetical protein